MNKVVGTRWFSTTTSPPEPQRTKGRVDTTTTVSTSTMFGFGKRKSISSPSTHGPGQQAEFERIFHQWTEAAKRNNVSLPSAAVNECKKRIKTPGKSKLDFFKTGLDDRLITLLVEVLSEAPVISKLDLGGNYTSDQSAICLIRLLILQAKQVREIPMDQRLTAVYLGDVSFEQSKSTIQAKILEDIFIVSGALRHANTKTQLRLAFVKYGSGEALNADAIGRLYYDTFSRRVDKPFSTRIDQAIAISPTKVPGLGSVLSYIAAEKLILEDLVNKCELPTLTTKQEKLIEEGAGPPKRPPAATGSAPGPGLGAPVSPQKPSSADPPFAPSVSPTRNNHATATSSSSPPPSQTDTPVQQRAAKKASRDSSDSSDDVVAVVGSKLDRQKAREPSPVPARNTGLPTSPPPSSATTTATPTTTTPTTTNTIPENVPKKVQVKVRTRAGGGIAQNAPTRDPSVNNSQTTSRKSSKPTTPGGSGKDTPLEAMVEERIVQGKVVQERGQDRGYDRGQERVVQDRGQERGQERVVQERVMPPRDVRVEEKSLSAVSTTLPPPPPPPDVSSVSHPHTTTSGIPIV